MGYRSEVGYVIAFGDKDLFKQFIVQSKLDPVYELCWKAEYETNFTQVLDDKLMLKFHATDVKWYDDYADVKCHEALLKLVDDYIEKYTEQIDTGISWSFIRIGEELDDNEHRTGGDGYNLWESIGISRTIDWGV
jgi:hypothetical protein